MIYNFRNLVFEGGGVKGIAYGGALSRIQEMGILEKIERVAGTSAGAITATLLSVGYDAQSISKIISETDFNKFQDNTFLFIRDLIRVFRKFGWNKGELFEVWMADLIEKKTGNKNLTFGQLHEMVLKNENQTKDLYIVATNVSKQIAEFISFENYPNMPIYKAVRMSMSIPLFFTAVKHQSDYFVDGGITANFPIQIFDNLKYVDNPKNVIQAYGGYDDTYAFNYETLGFRVDSNTEKNNLINPITDSNWNSTKSLKNFLITLSNFVIDMVNKKHLNQNDWNRTIFIDSGNVGTTDFKLNKEKINFLINSGIRGVDDYFFWRNNDANWNKFPE